MDGTTTSLGGALERCWGASVERHQAESPTMYYHPTLFVLVLYLLSSSVGGQREHSHNFRSDRPKPHLESHLLDVRLLIYQSTQ